MGAYCKEYFKAPAVVFGGNDEKLITDKEDSI
jgi:hypothetical protein